MTPTPTRVAALLAGFLLLATLPGSAAAKQTIEKPRLLETATSDLVSGSSGVEVAADGAGRGLASWSLEGSDAIGLATTGVSGPFANLGAPSFAIAGGGNVRAVVDNAQPDEDDADVVHFLVREVDATGKLGTPVALGPPSAEYGNAVIAGSSGGLVVGYCDTRDFDAETVRVFRRDAGDTWKELSVGPLPGPGCDEVAIAIASDGRVGVTAFVSGRGLHATVSAPDGTFPVKPWQRVASTDENVNQIAFGAGNEAIVVWTQSTKKVVSIRAAAAKPGGRFGTPVVVDPRAGGESVFLTSGISSWLTGAPSGARLAWPAGVRRGVTALRLARRSGGKWKVATVTTVRGTISKPRIGVVSGGEVLAWRSRPKGKSTVARVSTKANGAAKWTAPVSLSKGGEKVATVSLAAGGKQAYIAWDSVKGDERQSVLVSRVRP